MFKFIDKHPFISGFIFGFFGIGVVGKRLKRYIEGKITIIQLTITDVDNNLTFDEQPSVEKDSKDNKEN